MFGNSLTPDTLPGVLGDLVFAITVVFTGASLGRLLPKIHLSRRP